jgi:energy-coupling factor transport system ATP-binding protein
MVNVPLSCITLFRRVSLVEKENRQVNYALTLASAYVAFRTETGVKPVLTDLNLSISAGEWLAVVGRNGSGKSTLLRVLSGLLPLSKGEVARNADAERAMALVLQNPEAQLVGETVREDLYFSLENAGANPAEMAKLAQVALERVGLAAYLDAPVNGLSHGQKQLLAVAGGLALHARVLLFDEASAMLDPASAQQLFHAIKELQQKGTTVVWVTQQMDELYLADRVLAMDQGGQVFLGTPQEFFYNDASRSRIGLGEEPSSESAHAANAAFSELSAKHSELFNKHYVSSKVSPCERLGLQTPYAVQTALQLSARGIVLDPLPLTIADLAGHPALAACFGRKESAG